MRNLTPTKLVSMVASSALMILIIGCGASIPNSASMINCQTTQSCLVGGIVAEATDVGTNTPGGGTPISGNISKAVRFVITNGAKEEWNTAAAPFTICKGTGYTFSIKNLSSDNKAIEIHSSGPFAHASTATPIGQAYTVNMPATASTTSSPVYSHLDGPPSSGNSFHYVVKMAGTDPACPL